MEDLLRWAIVNSDGKELEQQAVEARRPAPGGDFLERQQQLATLLQAVKEQPTEAELIVEALTIVRNASEPAVVRGNALKALRILVEPLDNANDLDKLGGVGPMVALLGSPSPLLRAGAAYVLGTAASNNGPFQQTLMQAHPEVVPALMQLVNTASSGPAWAAAVGAAAAGTGGGPAGGSWWARWRGARAQQPAGEGVFAGDEHQQQQQQQPSKQQQQQQGADSEGGAGAAAAAEAVDDEYVANAGLYALAALLRGNLGARAIFYGAAGMRGLEALLLDSQQGLRVRLKALNLITDLIHQDASALPSGAAGLDDSATAAAMLQLLEHPLQAPKQQQEQQRQGDAIAELHKGQQEEQPDIWQGQPEGAAAGSREVAHIGASGPGGEEAVEEDLDMLEKALLALSALLEHRAVGISSTALEKARVTLGGLAQRLQGSTASAGEEDYFVQDVLALAQQVYQHVDAQLAQRKRAAEL
ncbi:hypothetical protein N2152v2_004635 [Parachlorella kessleri]